MKEICNCNEYKVLNVILQVGEKMPLHEATSDAFLMAKKGKGRITFADRIIDFSEGETLLIKAHEPHQMEILEDFSSYIILGNDGKINFLKQEIKETARSSKTGIEEPVSIY